MNVTEQTTAKCSRCHNVKPIADFQGRRKKGLVKNCIRCRAPRAGAAERTRIWRAKNKAMGIKTSEQTAARKREYQREYRLKNRAMITEKRRDYHREYQRKYRARKRLEKQKALALIATWP